MKNTKTTLVIILILVLLFGLGFLITRERGIFPRAEETPTGRSDDYLVQLKDLNAEQKELWVWDRRPEVGMGIHHIHDRLEPLQKIRGDLGLQIVRVALDWNDWESTEQWGKYDSSDIAWYDHWYSLAEQTGVELEFLVTTVVPHRQPPGVSFANREESYKRYANFVGDLSARYPKVKYWELFNEMEVWFTDLFGANTTTPSNLNEPINMFERGKLYAQMLKLAYPAIKKSNPDALVLIGGTTSSAYPDFFKGVYEDGGKNYFDIMNIHTYGQPLKDAFLDRGTKMRNLMDAFGDRGKPLWSTEFGINAGRIQKSLGFPRTWSTPTDTSQDPAECSWRSFAKNADGKLIYDGDGFDYQQCKEIRQTIEASSANRLYQKTLIFNYINGNEWACSYYSTVNDATCGAVLSTDPSKDTIDDYGFGINRTNIAVFNPRPTYNWLKAAQVNRAINQEPSFSTDVFVPIKGYVPEGYQSTTSSDGIIIKNIQVNSLLPTKIVLSAASGSSSAPIPVSTSSLPPSSSPPAETSSLPSASSANPTLVASPSSNPVSNFLRTQSPRTLTQSFKNLENQIVISRKTRWLFNIGGGILIAAGLIYLWICRRRRLVR